MEFRRIPLSNLIPDEDNPRKDLKPGDKEYKQIERSMDTFGVVDPIIFETETGIVIGGHQRLKVLQNKGIEELNVINLGGISWAFPETDIAPLTPEQRKALNIALNKITGSWDIPKLNILIENLKLSDIDITLTGWDQKELDKLMERQKPLVQAREEQDPGTIKDIIDIPEYDKGYFEGKENILLMYSGGLDSTYALLWARHNFPEKKTVAYYSDTGYELPGVLLNAWLVCQQYGVELRIVKPEEDMMINILTKGWPARHILPCRFKFIFEPIAGGILQHYQPEDSILIDGSSPKQTMAHGRHTRKTKYHKSFLKGLEEFDVYHPAYNIAREEIMAALQASGCPVWEGYNKGFVRTSCWLCTGINTDQIGAICQNYPHYTETVRQLEQLTGRKMDYVNNLGVDDYLATYYKRHERRRGGKNRV